MSREAVRARVLNPLERFSEIVFGLIMVLSFTGALSVAETGREHIRVMLIGALGCNLAWGIIDAACRMRIFAAQSNSVLHHSVSTGVATFNFFEARKLPLFAPGTIVSGVFVKQKQDVFQANLEFQGKSSGQLADTFEAFPVRIKQCETVPINFYERA